MGLNRGTNLLWKENEAILRKMLCLSGRVMTIETRFDENVVEFLLENERYLNYRLKLNLKRKEEVKALLKFIDAIDPSKKVQFQTIRWYHKL
jgi:hypothetical protein